MDHILGGIETILFCDETKFHINSGDAENAIYYLGIAVPKSIVPEIHQELLELNKMHKVKAPVFHASDIFKERNPRTGLLSDLNTIILKHKLICFCYKYAETIFFEPTKSLNYLNNEIINFDRKEFQAMFYFLIVLNTYIRDAKPGLLKREISMYFDRNVYGVKDAEPFQFPDENFILKHMTFVEKSRISLLVLPDYFGYIFRKSKQWHNKVQVGDKSIKPSKLTDACFQCLADISKAGLFHFLDVDSNIIRKALNI